MDIKDVPKKTIIYQNIEYEVCEWAIEKLKSIGISYEDEYISYLLQYDNPLSSQRLDILGNMDYINRQYIGTGSLLGRIVKIDKNGIICDYFENLFDAVIDSLNCNNKYSYEKLHNNGIYQSKITYDFFGTKINVVSKGKEIDAIKKLNSHIRTCKNGYWDKNNHFNKIYHSFHISSKLTYDEFKMQYLRWLSLSFSGYFQYHYSDCIDNEYTRHIEDNCNDYSQRINSLFKKYSNDKGCCFQKIYDLKQVYGLPGIYLLCFPKIKGCYVGKTEKCLLKRITQHFTTPNSIFDRKYTPTDVEEIYILQLDETLPFINIIEEDCISTLGKDICLNAFAGGNSIELIKSDKYNASMHTINEDLLEWVVSDSHNITQYRKECAENND